MTIIDFHTHAFPDDLAERAISALESECTVTTKIGGTVGDLIKSMDHAGIDASVVCSIATRPKQFTSILEWSNSIRSDRIIPFPSIHPDDPQAVERIRIIRDEGFKGVKLHPYYQQFKLDEPRMFDIYSALSDCDLILLPHTGFDIAFPFDPIADPQRILNVLAAFPDLTLVASHCGAWRDWDRAAELLLGRAVYMDISMSLEFMNAETARKFLTQHDKKYLLFGTDSPWAAQDDILDRLRAFNLDDDRMAHICHRNAERLLEI